MNALDATALLVVFAVIVSRRHIAARVNAKRQHNAFLAARDMMRMPYD